MLVRPSPRWQKRRTLYRPVIARRLPSWRVFNGGAGG